MTTETQSSLILKHLQEEWRPVNGWEGMYEVSNCGRVKSLQRKVNVINHRLIKTKTVREQILTPQLQKHGRYTVKLSDGFRCKTVPIHRIIALAFIPNTENKPVVMHLNDIPTDNRIKNLRWGTISENTRMSYVNGNSKFNPNKKFCKGAKHHCSNRVVQISNSGEFINEFVSITEAVQTIGLSKSAISHIYECLHGRRKSACGFKWKKAS